MDDDASLDADHGSDGDDDETFGNDPRASSGTEGQYPPGPSRPWVHPSEFRRFVHLDAPDPPSMLSSAEQTQRGAIAVAAMGCLLAGILLLTGGNHSYPQKTVPSAFAAPTTVLAHVIANERTTGDDGARVNANFAKRFTGNVLNIGDVILSCNHTRVHNATVLTRCLNRSASKRVGIDFIRGGSVYSVQVHLNDAP